MISTEYRGNRGKETKGREGKQCETVAE